MTEHWSTEDFNRFQKTGQKPEEVVKSAQKRVRRENLAEKEFQTICEQWLRHRGYKTMTADNAGTQEIVTGWVGHLFNAKKNPLLPDLFIYNPEMTRCLMIELKVVAVFQPGQQEMIDRGAWALAYNFQTVEGLVKSFEAQTQKSPVK